MQHVTLGYLLSTSPERTPVPILDRHIISIGREEHNTVLLDDLAASRKHANVEGYEGGIFITDLGSLNKTYVNDMPIKPHEAVPLLSGNEIRIGGRVFYVISPTSIVEKQKIVQSRAGAFAQKPTIGINAPKKSPRDQELNPEEPPRKPTYTIAPVSSRVPQTKRFDSSILPGQIPAHLEKPKSDAAVPSLTPALAGSIGRGGLPQILQMIHSKNLSGSMLVIGEQLAATILFREGELYSASTTFERGVTVIYRCALAKQAEFSFNNIDVAKVQKMPRNITMDTMHILMECCNKMYDDSKPR